MRDSEDPSAQMGAASPGEGPARGANHVAHVCKQWGPQQCGDASRDTGAEQVACGGFATIARGRWPGNGSALGWVRPGSKVTEVGLRKSLGGRKLASCTQRQEDLCSSSGRGKGKVQTTRGQTQRCLRRDSAGVVILHLGFEPG